MNAQLLSALPNATPAKSGLGAVLAQSDGAKGSTAKSAFAQLLGQQADAFDLSPELMGMLQQLGIDANDQKELLTQLKNLGVDADQLNQLFAQIKDTNDPKALLAALRQQNSNVAQQTAQTIAAYSNTDRNTSSTNSSNHKGTPDFVNSTLFVANESKAMRSESNARFAIDNHKKTNTRFDLNHLADGTKGTKNTKADSNKIDAKNFQTALNIAHKGSSGTGVSAGTGTTASANLNNELSGLNAANSQSTANANSSTGPSTFTPNYSAQINTPLQHTAQWSQDFGRVMIQLGQQANQTSTGTQTAEIRLDPPELGPLRIVLSMNDSVANATIFATHAQTRLAVEQSLPQLQQQLAQSGLNLGETNVSSDQNAFAQAEQHAKQDKNDESGTFNLHDLNQGNGSDSSIDSANQRPVIDPNAIIDTFV